MTEPKSLLLVGKVRPERKRSLTGMAVSSQMPLASCEGSVEALAWLDRNDPACLVVDAGVARLDKVIGKVRAQPQLAHVPVFALVSTPDDLWIEQYFGWGGDDVVQMDAGATLLERLRAVPRVAPPAVAGRRVVIAEPDRSRLEVLGRVFRLAGFHAEYVTERAALETAIQRFDPGAVVANAALGDLTLALERTRAQGVNAAWAILAARREIDSQLISLGSLSRCFVAGAQSNPWQLLTRVNDLMRDDSLERRRAPRLALGSFVLFRAAGSDDDEVGILHNLSSNGMFVRTYAPVTSDEVWLEWRVPQDKTRVRLEGKVVWRQSSLTDASRPACPLGFGLEFRDYLGGARKHLERALEVLEAGARRTSASPSVAPVASSRLAENSSGESKAPTASEAPPATNRFPSIKPLSDTLSFGKPPEKQAPPTTPGSQSIPEARKGGVSRPQPPAVATNPAVEGTSAAKLSQKATLTGAGPRLNPSTVESPGSRTAGEAPGRHATTSDRPPARIQAEAKPGRTDSVASASPASIERGERPEPRRQPAPPPAVRLTAPQAPRFDAPARPKGTAGAIAAPPRPGGPNATTLGVGGAAVAADAVGASDLVASDALPATGSARAPGSMDSTDQSSPDVLPATALSSGTERKLSPNETSSATSAPVDATANATNLDVRREIPKADDAKRTASFEVGSIGANLPVTSIGGGALFEIAEDSLPPAAESHDDAPTVVAAPPAFSMGDEGSRDEAEFSTEEAETSQFNVAAFRDVPDPRELMARQVPAKREPAGREVARLNASSFDEFQVPNGPSVRKIALGLTVAILGILAGGLWLYRSDLLGKPKTPSRSNLATTAPQASSPVLAASSAPSASASVSPVASAVAPAAASSEGEVPLAPLDDGGPLDGYPPVEEFQLGNGRNLADRYGYLVVRFPEAAFIFSNHIAVGATNWKIATTCGEKVLRIGVGEKPVTWLSQDMKVNVACRDTTRVVFRRIEGVVAPPGVQRPISPAANAARKPPKPDEGTDSATRSERASDSPTTQPKSMDAKSPDRKIDEGTPGEGSPASIRSAEPAPVKAPASPGAEPQRETIEPRE